jgi:phosphatidylglycerol:prolipoprotein diacylglycerol transferase
MLPKIVEWGDFFLPTYGVLLAIAFLTAIWLAGRLGAKVGIQGDRIMDIGLVAALAGIAGAKLAMFLFDWNYYSAHPGDIFALSTLQAAGVFQGGLILALIVSIWYMRRKRLPVLRTMDVFAPGLALGHAIGRLGCFAAGCCWGAPTNLPWAVTFTNEESHRRFGTPLSQPLHPSQIYESAAELVILAILLRLFARPHRDGSIVAWYLILYSVVRFLIAFVRNHEQSLVGGLSLTQWISLATLLAGALLLRNRQPSPVPAKTRA